VGVLYIELILLVILQLLLTALQMVGSRPGSDHYYHVGLINGIRDNGHKFVQSHPNIIGEKYFVYPQLYHWILSFVPSMALGSSYRLFGLGISFFQLMAFLLFSFTLYPFIPADMGIEQFMLLSGLVFVLTPFSYAIWNAKNRGISARGFGLFLGQVYLYFIIWYYLFDKGLFFILAFLMAFVIILSSQFAMQFVLFSAPLLALFFKNPIFLLIPVFAFGMYYLIMPEIARNFVKGEIGHKTIYYKYLADKYILDYRHSIWLDFLRDFWVKRFENFKRKFVYILYNPLLSLIWGFPVLTLIFLCFFFCTEMRAIWSSEDKSILYLTIPVIVTFCIFLLTSFRKTRFLGESERYMEFSIPQLSVLGGIFLQDLGVIAWIILGFCSLLVLSQFMLRHLQVSYGFSNQHNQAMKGIKEHLSKIGNGDNSSVRIFSNNGEVNKWFLTGKFEVLTINFTSLYTGRFHFKEIFPVEFPYVSEELLIPLVREFDINWLILDLTHISNYPEFLDKEVGLLKEEMAVSRYRLLRVC